MNPKKGTYKKFCNLVFHLKILLFFLLISMSHCLPNAWATDIYIDPNYSGEESGTFSQPYNSWNDVIPLSSSKDYRQKCGTQFSQSRSLSLSATGTADDYVIIGAYYNNAGIPVHEDDNPSFGENCGNGTAKPIIINTNGNASDTLRVTGDYVEVNSIQAHEGINSIRPNGNHMRIVYNQVIGGKSGIRCGQVSSTDNIYIAYNYLYSDHGPAPSLPGILIFNMENAIVEYNYIDGFSLSGIITWFNSDNNIIRYNKIYSWDQHMDHCMQTQGHNNKYLHNYCHESGIFHISRGSGSEIAYNIVDGLSNNPYYGPTKGVFNTNPVYSEEGISNFKIHNNVVYDRGGHPDVAWNGINIYVGPRHKVPVKGMQYYNNVFINLQGDKFGNTQPPISITDNYNLIESNPSNSDVNIFRNNIFYGQKDSRYAVIEGKTYYSAATFNRDYGAAYNNRDNDPGLKDPSKSEFWPTSASSAVVGNGYDGGEDSDKLLSPLTTVWGEKTSAPLVQLTTQPTSWVIGAYAFGVAETPRLRAPRNVFTMSIK